MAGRWVEVGEASRERPSVAAGEARVEVLSEQVAYLEEQLDVPTEELEVHRRMHEGRDERIPELEPPSEQEAPQEPPGGPPSAGAGSVREEAPPAGGDAQEAAQPRSWWQRMFGG